MNADMSEKQIENLILNWLGWKNIYVWKTKTTGTWDGKRGRYLKPSKLYRTGVADIIGILPSGKLLAIEVKSKKGRVAPHQYLFLNEISLRGGVALVARSLEDVELALSKHLGGEIERDVVIAEP